MRPTRVPLQINLQEQWVLFVKATEKKLFDV